MVFDNDDFLHDPSRPACHPVRWAGIPIPGIVARPSPTRSRRIMLVQVITDNHIQGSDALSRSIEDGLQQELGHFSERITHVEVHLYDLNGPKAGVDKRCMMEARLAGLSSVSASHEADNLDEANDGASEKLHRVIEHKLGKLNDSRGRTSSAGGD